MSDQSDGLLQIIVRLSSGTDKHSLRKELQLSDPVFRKRLKDAYRKLRRVANLTEEAASAIIGPRSHGTPPNPKYLPRYSTHAVTIERARELDAFHDSWQLVREACQELSTFGLSDMSDWISGWRPANHHSNLDIETALNAVGADIFLYVWPEGLRFEHMKGSVNSIHLQMLIKSPTEGLLSGILLHDVKDPASSCVFCEGAAVAVHLSSTDEERWLEYVRSQRVSRKPLRVGISKYGDDPSLMFSPLHFDS
jgi:hypothetical protein